ncbi:MULTISPECIES: DUF1566 domain-containing protein [unclassified Shewanella]|uniref:Lcl C-terminal domain-containing protein n=1 Tax=unclassified Shewanella TaxID=196818 RepID=UPI00355203ED
MSIVFNVSLFSVFMFTLLNPVYAQIETQKLPDTGQSVQYDVKGKPLSISNSSLFTGQDASIEGNSLSYKDNEDGTVTDLNTGLMWQKSHDTTKRNLAESTKVINNMTLGGYDDWRLPTIKELYSLANFDGQLMKPESGQESRPYLDTAYFDFNYDKRIPFAGAFWSSTVYNKSAVQNFTAHGGLQGGFGFNFADGHIKSYETGLFFDQTTIQKSDHMFVPGNFVRAVRNTTTLYDMDYIDNNNGTITDQSTGLMWAKNDSGQQMDWVKALAFADNALLAGYSDWRLPNAKELQSLVDYEKKDLPTINTEFFNVTQTEFKSQQDAYYVWTSTTQGDFKHTAVYISFAQAWSKKDSNATEYFDWHGAGAQRSDPKSGKPSDYELASEMASDYISINNWVRLVRDAK